MDITTLARTLVCTACKSGGVATFDCDGDGLPKVYVTCTESRPSRAQEIAPAWPCADLPLRVVWLRFVLGHACPPHGRRCAHGVFPPQQDHRPHPHLTSFALKEVANSAHSHMKPTGDQQLVKRINCSMLLRLLRVQPGLSRAQLAAQSGVTKSTVSLLVRELIDEDWLTETAVAPSTGQADSRAQLGPATCRPTLRQIVRPSNNQALSTANFFRSISSKSICAPSP